MPQIFQTLQKQFDLMALAIFLGCLLVVIAAGLWYVRKTTGRPMRDMLAVFTAGIILVALMLSFVALEPKSWSGRRHASPAEYLIFVALALSLTWIFNKIAKRKSKKQSRHQGPVDKSEPLE
jgi:hypothetical protein